MSKKCKAYSESKLGLEPPDNRKAFYAGWDAALAAEPTKPSGYAYRYADNVLRFNDGGWLNGWPPVEAVPYWFAPPALAAEQPKPEPVAYFDLQKQVFYWARPTMIDVPMTIALEPLPLYTAPPEDEALRRDAERLKTDAEMMRWLIDNHTAWSWNPSRYNTDVIGGFAAFSTGYLGFDLKTAIRKAMQDSAMQEDKT